jgi:predicted metal-dependent enzyme (double-stranded beta helix superfamily)
MDLLDQLLSDTRDAMSGGQAAVTAAVHAVLVDHERLAASVFDRPKPWFFAADETMTVFCTEGRPGNASAPHDHGSWSVLGCFEGSEESWWHEPDDATGLKVVGSGVLRAGQAHSLPADAIHAVMNRWTTPNGVLHIYEGNFLAADRHIWDPITHQRTIAGLAEPLAPATDGTRYVATDGTLPARAALAGTAFASIAVNDLGAAASWMADAFGLQTLTTHDDTCAIDERFNYLIEPASLTIIGLHATGASSTRAHLEHVALRVASLQHLRQWHDDLSQRGFNPSAITTWSFGTFVDVVGPQQLTVRLFVPAVR